MKKQFALVFLLAMLFPFSMKSVNLNGAYYEGIAKMKGKPIDGWLSLELDDEDAEINFCNKINFAAPYTQSAMGDKVTLTVAVPGNPKAVFTSEDGGDTFQGVLNFNGQKFESWVLRVPKKLKKATLPDKELEAILSSPEGYTSFCVMENAEGKASITSDFSFSPEGHFSMICDSQAMQNHFRNLKGTYQVSDGKVILNAGNGVTLTGDIYDDGRYIKIPLGKGAGINWTIILIR